MGDKRRMVVYQWGIALLRLKSLNLIEAIQFLL